MSNKASKTKKTAAAKPEGAGPLYISFNPDEWAALQKLGFRERWAYAQLKWLSNFKTGMLGKHLRQRISYQDIANLVTVPGVQGRGMGNIDDTQAADFMQRMATVGLIVQHPNRANGGLVFELPLSPIDRKPQTVPAAQPVAITPPAPVMAISPDQPAQKGVISPDEDIPPFDENPAATRVCDAPTLSLSVMTLKESNINTDGAPSAHDEAAPPSRATGAAAAWEIPPTQHQPVAVAAPLTARQIQDAVAGSWTFTHTATPEALALYASWADAGITLDDLHGAMDRVGDDPACAEPTPEHLASGLWPKVVDGWFDQLAA